MTTKDDSTRRYKDRVSLDKDIKRKLEGMLRIGDVEGYERYGKVFEEYLKYRGKMSKLEEKLRRMVTGRKGTTYLKVTPQGKTPPLEKVRWELLNKVKEICVKCGVKGGCHVHHINRDRYDNRIENLMALCPKCHKGEHPVQQRVEDKKRLKFSKMSALDMLKRPDDVD